MKYKSEHCSWAQWFRPLIPAIMEAQIEKIMAQGQHQKSKSQ
jgi:hypothetical protein